MAGSDVYHLPVLPAFIGSGVQLSAFEGCVLTGTHLSSVLFVGVWRDFREAYVVSGCGQKCRRLRVGFATSGDICAVW